MESVFLKEKMAKEAQRSHAKMLLSSVVSTASKENKLRSELLNSRKITQIKEPSKNPDA